MGAQQIYANVGAIAVVLNALIDINARMIVSPYLMANGTIALIVSF